MLLLVVVIHNLLDGTNIIRPDFLEMLDVQLFDELGQRQLPGFLLRVGEAAELLGIQPQLSGHLDVGMGKLETLPRFDPSLVFLWYPILLCQRTNTYRVPIFSGNYAMPVISLVNGSCRYPNGCRLTKKCYDILTRETIWLYIGATLVDRFKVIT